MSRLLLLAICLTVAPVAWGADELVVHEWGTFTSFQDENGTALGWINSDDEPVPAFVHGIGPRGSVVDGRAGRDPTSLLFSKAIPASHPDVTMRLETPVIYFHMPKGTNPTTVDVAVTFNGGWLTQFFPYALADIDGKRVNEKEPFAAASLLSTARGALAWDRLKVGTGGAGAPRTDERVWLAPRAVSDAANLTVRASADGKRESEKFLFYRGVGHVDAPLRVTRDGDTLRINSDCVTAPAWFVDVREDGRCAFRPIDLAARSMPASFAETDYRPGVGELRSSMRAALIRDGLFADEADAMMNTWEVSYFKNAGTRVFFLVPRAWTDGVLPLGVSHDGKRIANQKIVRTMVGRVELITPAMREKIRVVAESTDDVKRVAAYQSLGRFRDALVIAESSARPTPSLARFMQKQVIRPAKFPVSRAKEVSLTK